MSVTVQVVEVRPRDGWKIWVRFSDGVSGEVDVGWLRGNPLFADLENRMTFEGVSVHPNLKVVSWGENLEIDPCDMYDKLAEAKAPAFAGATG